MRLTVVGCSGSHPGPDAACSAYLVEHDGFRLLLDLGNGALGPLQAHVDPRELDALWISHLHGDHWLDLVPLAHVRRHHPDGPARARLRVTTPSADRGRIAGAFGRAASDLDDVFAFDEPATGELGPFAVRVARTAHPVEAYAIRISAGDRSLVYTGDTGPLPELDRFAKDADVLLAEAGFADQVGPQPGLHLTGGQAGELAKRAGCGRLIVTHVAPWHDPQRALEQAAQAFGGEAVLARPHEVHDL